MIRTLKAMLVASALVLGFGATASATSVAPSNLAQIVDKAQIAFVCTIDSVDVEKTSQGWAEKITVTIKQPVIGSFTAGQTYTWYQARFGETLRIPSMPEFTAGDEELVILANSAPGSIFQAPIGLGQGAFEVTRDEQTGAVTRVSNDSNNLYTWVNIDVDKVAARVKSARAAAGKTKAPDALEALVATIKVLDASADPVEEFKSPDPVPVSGTVKE